MSRLTLSLFFVASIFLSSCAHVYVQGTGLPADVADRFLFHVMVEAQQRSYRTAKSETGLTVFAGLGDIRYYPGEHEIMVDFVIPNVSGKTENYYRNERQHLQKLNSELINGARQRARQARDFAY